MYHPGKANVVADALRRRAVQSLSMMITDQVPLFEDVSSGVSTRLFSTIVLSTLLDRIRESQSENP